MADPHGDPQTSPQHADPHGRGAFLKTSISEIHVDRRVVGWSAGRHVDQPCGGQNLQLPARKVTENCRKFSFVMQVLDETSNMSLGSTVHKP